MTSTNPKKLPQLFEKALPIPDRKATITAVHKYMLKIKGPFDGPLVIVFLGLFAINVFALTDPLGAHPLSSYLPWLVLLASFVALGLLMLRKVKQTEELTTQINACYAKYLNHPIHLSYNNQLDFYHSCLREWKFICFENEHLIQVTKTYYHENQWNDHVRQFETSVKLRELGDGLAEESSFMKSFYSYQIRYGHPLRLSQLYKDHLTFDKTCRFMQAYQQCKASFTPQFNDQLFIKTLTDLQAVLAAEEADLLKDINDCFRDLITTIVARQEVYLQFKQHYLTLTAALGVNQAPFN